VRPRPEDCYTSLVPDFPTELDKKAWAVAQIADLLKNGRDEHGARWTQASLAVALQITRGQVWHITKSTPEAPRGPGDGTFEGLRRLLKLTKPGAFEEAVMAWRREHPVAEMKIEEDEPYPNLAIAAKFASQSHIAQEAIDQVRRSIAKGQTDLSPVEWLDLIRHADRVYRLFERNPQLKDIHLRQHAGPPEEQLRREHEEASREATERMERDAAAERRARELAEEAEAPTRATGLRRPASEKKPRK
jgi:hypothetical protein